MTINQDLRLKEEHRETLKYEDPLKVLTFLVKRRSKKLTVKNKMI